MPMVLFFDTSEADAALVVSRTFQDATGGGPDTENIGLCNTSSSTSSSTTAYAGISRFRQRSNPDVAAGKFSCIGGSQAVLCTADAGPPPGRRRVEVTVLPLRLGTRVTVAAPG
eukprot:3932027-Rhodomonas_salina.1